MAPPPFDDSSLGLPGGGWSIPGVTGLEGAAPVGLPPVSDAVAALLAAVVEQSAVVASEVPGAQALADLAGLLAVRDQLDRVLLVRLGDVEARQLAGLDGAASTASWLRQQDGDLPASTLATARRMRRHPCLGDAVADSRLDPKDAEHIGRALSSALLALDEPDGLIDGQDAEPVLTAVIVDGALDCLGEAWGGLTDTSPRLALLDRLRQELTDLAAQTDLSQLDRLERALVVLAQHLPDRWLPTALARLMGALLPSRLEDAARKAEHDRRLSLTPDPDGGGHLRGRLSPEAYELLHTALTAAAQTDPDNPGDTDTWRQARAAGWLPGDPLPEGPAGDSPVPGSPFPGSPFPGSPVPNSALPLGSPAGPGSGRSVVRSRGARLHDALVLVLRATLSSPALGVRGKTVPRIAVTVPLATLNRAPGSLPAVGGSGQRLPLSLVTAWMRDAWITRYVLDLRHRVIETSHTERTLKAHERQILQIQTGAACQSAHCPHGPQPPPGTRLVPHHPDAWATTGTTSVHDTAVLCEQEHWELHHGATLTLRDGRRINADGWVS